MTEKAKKILARMRKPGIQEEFNRSTLDDVGLVAGGKGEKFLSELNEMAELKGDGGRRETSDFTLKRPGGDPGPSLYSDGAYLININLRVSTYAPAVIR